MLGALWAIFVFSIYSSAIVWLIISKIVGKLTKEKYSFKVDMVIFACLFAIAAIAFAILLC